LVAARIAQVTSTGGNVLVNFATDVVSGRAKDADLEVQRAAELRDTITSLGPFFIKVCLGREMQNFGDSHLTKNQQLGQALSIRPDILSPRR